MRRLFLGLMMLWPGTLLAQSASLVADSLRIEADSRLVAEGEVELLYGDSRLQASRLVFDQKADRLTIEGPITLTEGDRVVILADQGDLNGDLQDGILVSARLVLDRQLQLAANRIDRVGGRYTQLTRSVTSSCQICDESPVPQWEIRAKRVIHDQLERQLYFDQAVFRLGGVPVFYIPRLRLPDPFLSRATGFLLPSLHSSTELGVGFKQPYFVTLGDHADVTLTPFISTKTRTLELEYRQELSFGKMSFEGAVSEDDLEDGQRYYLFGEGEFQLPADFKLSFDLEMVSDSGYLLDYGYSSKDRLDSEIRLSRVDQDTMLSISVHDFKTLRDSELEIESELPAQYAQLSYEKRKDLAGGELRFGLDGAILERPSSEDIVGRDVQRIGAYTTWRRSMINSAGMVLTGEAGMMGYAYHIEEDSTYDTHTGQVTTGAAVTLRWPFQKTASDGAGLLIEPVAQLVYTDTRGASVPNEESLLVEFDEGNLFSFSRFPGSDAIEQGLRANLGVSFTRYDPSGWSLGVTLGRVIRVEDLDQFTSSTGLDGTASDWLAAVQLDLSDRLDLTHKMLFSSDFDVSRAESRLDYSHSRATLSGTYVYLVEDEDENRPDPTHEIAFDTTYRLNRHWTGKLDGRYDLVSEQAAKAGIGLEYQSECLTVDLSLSRRFTSSSSVSASTSVGLELSLAGFGTGGNTAAYRRSCQG